jgi:hypothetical protein
MESTDLISVYSLQDATEAQMIKNFLHAEGIRCFLSGEATAANLGLPVFTVDILVPAIDADRAGKLIECHERLHASRIRNASRVTRP